MCYCGCNAENSSGECKLSKNFLCDEDYEENEIEEPEEIEPTEQEVSDAEDRYFN